MIYHILPHFSTVEALTGLRRDFLRLQHVFRHPGEHLGVSTISGYTETS